MSLIEVTLAIFIMALVIGSSMAAMLRVYPMLDTARSVTLAGQMMQDELERLRLKNWTQLNSVSSGAVTLDSRFTAKPTIGTRFTMDRQIDALSTNMRRITLTVSWTSADGHAMSRSYEARYARDGIYDFTYSDS